jgi:MFS family permease
VTSLEVTIRLLGMEAGLIVLIGALGSGLAVLAPGRIPPAARIALAPAMGLGAGFPIMLTASQFMSMSVGAFAVLLPLAVLSAAYAVLRTRRSSSARRPPGRHVLALALAVSIPLAVLSAPLIEERSLGPVSYQVADAAEYAALNDSLEDNSWRDERFGLGRGEDLLVHQTFASPIFQSGTAPFASALNAIFGWAASDAQSALMIALVAIGSLGCFALVLTMTASAWAAVTAAVLYAGPVNYQLFIDGSQAALAALAMLGPMAVVGARLFAMPVAAGALFGLLAGGVMTVYPAFLPVVAGAVGLAMALHLIRDRRRARLKVVLIASGTAVAAVALLAPVSLAKNISYVSAVSEDRLDEPAGEAAWDVPVEFAAFGERVEPSSLKESFPPFVPPAEAAVGWVTQSRERYELPALADVSLPDAAILGIALPAAVLVLAGVGVLKWRNWAFLLLPVAVSLALAYYGFQAQDCSYCGQRALLPIPPILIVLACCGLVAVAAWIRSRTDPPWAGIAVSTAAALVLVGTAVANDRALAERLIDGGYLLGDEAREVLDEASGEVLIEGAGSGNPYTAFFESNLLPHATREATGELPLLDPNGLAIAIFPERFPPPIPSNPGYELVFTRLAGVESGRRVVAERGPYALEERVSPLDVTIVNGVVSDLAQRDPAGMAWVKGPVELLVADTERAPAHVTLELSGPQAASLRLAGHGEIVREDGRALVCVPAPGRSPMRRVGVPLRFEEGTFLPAPNPQDPPTPPTDLELEAVSAARECPSVFEH